MANSPPSVRMAPVRLVVDAVGEVLLREVHQLVVVEGLLLDHHLGHLVEHLAVVGEDLLAVGVRVGYEELDATAMGDAGRLRPPLGEGVVGAAIGVTMLLTPRTRPPTRGPGSQMAKCEYSA